MEKIIVGSVFLENSRIDSLYKLQTRFIRKTTSNFKHVVCTNSNYSFSDSVVIKNDSVPAEKDFLGSRHHTMNLNFLLDYFKNSEAELFLILDSDCFPVKNGWMDILLSSMGDFLVAAPVRFENLETHAHPCAFFFRRRALDYLKFEVSELKSLTGTTFKDTCSNAREFFPLVRTNKFNPHPVFFGIYWDIFYHHGAASRYGLGRTRIRSCDVGYYDPKKALSDEENHMFFENLLDNPNSFIMNIKGVPVC